MHADSLLMTVQVAVCKTNVNSYRHDRMQPSPGDNLRPMEAASLGPNGQVHGTVSLQKCISMEIAFWSQSTKSASVLSKLSAFPLWDSNLQWQATLCVVTMQSDALATEREAEGYVTYLLSFYLQIHIPSFKPRRLPTALVVMMLQTMRLGSGLPMLLNKRCISMCILGMYGE